MRKDIREALLRIYKTRYVGKTIVDIRFNYDTQEFCIILDDGTEIEI